MKITGARCLIAGGARGLGAALALDLARGGADVALTYHRSQNAAGETRAEIVALGRRAIAVHADLTDTDSASAAVAGSATELGGLDVVVYLASGPFAPQRPDQIDPKQWAASLDTIAKGFFFTAQAAYRAFVGDSATVAPPGLAPAPRGTRGVIVAITDPGGIAPWAAFAAHGAAKAAQIYLVRALAKAWGADGVRVCGVAPGPLDTADDKRREASERAARRTVIGRLEHLDEVAHAVRFCIENDYVTGLNLVADGGLLLR